MARITTSNYQADVDTIFQWATVDGDFFDRELDLSFLARALERHDHSANRGLPVSRVATGSIVTASFAVGAVDANAIGALAVTTAKLNDLAVTVAKIADLAVTTAKIADLNVTTGKLAAGAVTVDKITTMTGPITWTATVGNKINIYSNIIGISIQSGQAILFTTGGVVWGVANDSAGTGFGQLWHAANDGAGSTLDADLLDAQQGTFYLARANHTGTQAPATISPQGTGSTLDADKLDGLDSTAFALVATGVPLGAVVWFRTAAELTAAGAAWTTETSLAGRIPYGAGTTHGQTFTENTNTSTTNWTPVTGLTNSTVAILADGQTVLVNNGATTSVATSTHTHPAPTINGQGSAWFPPGRVGVFGRKI